MKREEEEERQEERWGERRRWREGENWRETGREGGDRGREMEREWSTSGVFRRR